MKQHKTLENLSQQAWRKGVAKQGNWKVKFENGVYTYYHWGTKILEVSGYGDVHYIFGTSKSDADAMNAMCYYHGAPERFTFKPVNGGFMQVS